jgi:succinate-semialdehyde dehydrogenase/glutarate-semialdehyde dehydrogenase
MLRIHSIVIGSDPATEIEIGKVPEMNVEDTKEAIEAAKKAFKEWANLTAKVSYYYHQKYV